MPSEYILAIGLYVPNSLQYVQSIVVQYVQSIVVQYVQSIVVQYVQFSSSWK